MHVHACTHTRIHVWTHTHMHARMHGRMHAHMHTHACIHTRARTHTQTHTHNPTNIPHCLGTFCGCADKSPVPCGSSHCACSSWQSSGATSPGWVCTHNTQHLDKESGTHNHQVPLHLDGSAHTTHSTSIMNQALNNTNLVGSAHTTHNSLIKNQALTNMNHTEGKKAHATTNLKSVFLYWYVLSEVCLWTGICCLKSIFELAHVVWSLSLNWYMLSEVYLWTGICCLSLYLNWHMLSEICLPELAYAAMASK